jgi:hypothetical protein
MSKFIKVRTQREGEHPGAEYLQIINLDNVVRLSVPSLYFADGTEIKLTGSGIRDFEKAIDMR